MQIKRGDRLITLCSSLNRLYTFAGNRFALYTHLTISYHNEERLVAVGAFRDDEVKKLGGGREFFDIADEEQC